MRGKPFFQTLRRFELRLLSSAILSPACGLVARRGASIHLALVKLSNDALVVGLDDVFWNSLHREDLEFEAGSVRQRILDGREGFLVDLVKVYRKA